MKKKGKKRSMLFSFSLSFSELYLLLSFFSLNKTGDLGAAGRVHDHVEQLEKHGGKDGDGERKRGRAEVDALSQLGGRRCFAFPFFFFAFSPSLPETSSDDSEDAGDWGKPRVFLLRCWKEERRGSLRGGARARKGRESFSRREKTQRRQSERK